MSKYDFNLDLEDRNSIAILLKQIKENSTVLEFGPANGRMTKYMKEELNCKVYAVEIDGNAAKDTAQYTEKIIVDNIESYNWKTEFNSIQFDYIIFADVLEHLYYPGKVLENVKDFLKDDGSILISIPNIAHNAIIINLLKNEFNYSPIGLLDDTHIRFFTKKTFDDLIKKVGYFINYETAIYINPRNTEFANSYTDIPPEIAEYLQNQPCGEIYQFIYKIKKYETSLKSDFANEYKKYQNYFNQLFIEDENGFSEENSIRFSVLENNKSQIFKFDLKDKINIKSLRFDPLNKYCTIKISRILINEEVYDCFLDNNAFYKENDTYYFNTDDSQIFLNISKYKVIRSISFDLQYIHIGTDTTNQIFNDFARILNQKAQNIQNLNQELNHKAQNIQNLNQELEDKNQNINILKEKVESIKLELTSIYTSKSWKITKPLRQIMRKLKK